MRYRHEMPFGAEALGPDATRLRLWAPTASRIEAEVEAEGKRFRLPLAAADDGWFEAVAPVGPGSAYDFVIDGGMRIPDPASRWNPQGVHGASVVVDPLAFEWDDAWRGEPWRGRPWEEAVIYELHVGAFTAEGSFAAVARRLDELAELGVTAIELMPVAAFPGARNWGYDGVLAFAPAAAYGHPEELKRLVQAAHARGLMVLLDVVYNHFGPEGNYLHLYAADFFRPDRDTPWGAALNYDGPGSSTVREFFIHNALFWLEEYRVDGLRLDAVHAIRDASPAHLVEELAERVAAGPGALRHVHLVLENDDNIARFLGPGQPSAGAARTAARPLGGGPPGGRPRRATAQWNDDLHHAAHVLLTGEADGYYADFADDPVGHLGRCLAEGFAWQGERSPYRGGAPRGEPSAHLPPIAFVAFLQNHDQIGNRACGERLVTLAAEGALATLQACVLLAPQVPLLFMGEEFGATSPFLFFCDFGADLAEAVTHGRRAEFARFERFHTATAQAAIPDPNAAATFERSRLDRREAERARGRAWRARLHELLALRREHVVPRLAGAAAGRWRRLPPTGLAVDWPMGDGTVLHLVANLGAGPVTLAAATRPAGKPVLARVAGAPAPMATDMLPPWSVYWTLGSGHG